MDKPIKVKTVGKVREFLEKRLGYLLFLFFSMLEKIVDGFSKKAKEQVEVEPELEELPSEPEHEVTVSKVVEPAPRRKGPSVKERLGKMCYTFFHGLDNLFKEREGYQEISVGKPLILSKKERPNMFFRAIVAIAEGVTALGNALKNIFKSKPRPSYEKRVLYADGLQKPIRVRSTSHGLRDIVNYYEFIKYATRPYIEPFFVRFKEQKVKLKPVVKKSKKKKEIPKGVYNFFASMTDPKILFLIFILLLLVLGVNLSSQYISQDGPTTTLPLTAEACAQQDGLSRDVCYRDLGIDQADSSYCALIEDSSSESNLRDYCYEKVAGLLQDAALCSLIQTIEIEGHYLPDACYFNIASATQNATLCGQVRDLQMRDICLTTVEVEE